MDLWESVVMSLFSHWWTRQKTVLPPVRRILRGRVGDAREGLPAEDEEKHRTAFFRIQRRAIDAQVPWAPHVINLAIELAVADLKRHHKRLEQTALNPNRTVAGSEIPRRSPVGPCRRPHGRSSRTMAAALAMMVPSLPSSVGTTKPHELHAPLGAMRQHSQHLVPYQPPPVSARRSTSIRIESTSMPSAPVTPSELCHKRRARRVLPPWCDRRREYLSTHTHLNHHAFHRHRFLLYALRPRTLASESGTIPSAPL